MTVGKQTGGDLIADAASRLRKPLIKASRVGGEWDKSNAAKNSYCIGACGADFNTNPDANDFSSREFALLRRAGRGANTI